MKKFLLLITALCSFSLSASEPLRFEHIELIAPSTGGVNMLIEAAGGVPDYEITLTGFLPTVTTTSTPEISYTGFNKGFVYTITIEDANGQEITAIMDPRELDSSELSKINVTFVNPCTGQSNGVINIVQTVNVPGATSFSLNAVQNSTCDGQLSCSFTGLVAQTTYLAAAEFTPNGGTSHVATVETSLVNLSAPVIATTASPTTCGEDNGSIEVTSTAGGVPPYLYSLDGGTTTQSSTVFTGLAAGSYTVTVIDANGCTGSNSGINVGPSIGVTITNVDIVPPTCPGDTNGSITVFAAPVGPTLKYMLNGQVVNSSTGSASFNNLAPGTYAIMVVDEATTCSAGAMAMVPEKSPIQFIPDVDKPTCVNVKNGSIFLDNASVSGGTPPYTYTIQKVEDGNGFAPPKVVGNAFEGLKPGTYKVKVIDANDCESAVLVVEVEKADRIKIVDVDTAPATGPGFDNGVILIDAESDAPLWYSIDGGNSFQNSPLFEGLAVGKYDIVVNRRFDSSSKCASRTVHIR